jgi:hypothetical protein
LNGTFLVDAEHRCIDRRLEIQTDDIGGFFLELWIVTGNIAAQSMRLEPSFGQGNVSVAFYGRHRGRSRSQESVRLEARVLRLAQRKPADGSTHWSTRKIAAEVGTNHVRVTRT